MSKILTGAEILTVAKEICEVPGEVYLAVSYWGADAASIFHEIAGDRLHVVLDVNAGGTDPKELKYLMKHMGERVRVHRDLHTKLFASASDGLIGSANATRPGLQLRASARVEAAVRVQGDEAAALYEFAKSVYNDAAPATKEHLSICKKRYQRVPLGRSEYGEIERLDLLTALYKQPALYRELPLLVTNEPLSKKARDDAWQAQQPDRDGDQLREYDGKRWDSFGWPLDPKLDGQLCLAFHVGEGKAVWAGLVRPLAQPNQEITFARRVTWSEIPGLSYNSHTIKRLKGDERLKSLRRAIDKLVSKTEETGEDTLLVSDLLDALSKADKKLARKKK